MQGWMAPLEDDCKLLRNLLDDCLRIEVGENLFNKVTNGSHAGIEIVRSERYECRSYGSPSPTQH